VFLISSWAGVAPIFGLEPIGQRLACPHLSGLEPCFEDTCKRAREAWLRCKLVGGHRIELWTSCL
jgi:hypothetical protein